MKAPLLAILVLSITSLPAFAKWGTKDSVNAMMSGLFDGPPKLRTTQIDPSAYVEEQVQRLANPKIAYVNWRAITDILTEMGFDEIPTRLTPELTEAILKRAGFAKRMKGEPLSAYVDEFRTLFSIRYGGRWLNYNLGSGRNGASGIVDFKGIGQTVLVRPWADNNHASGTMVLSETMKEILWSNLLHEELPLGANRVLFVLTTGTQADPADPNSQARALMIREDMMRPAYFQQNDGVNSERIEQSLREMHMAADQKRVQAMAKKFVDALPQAEGFRKGRKSKASIVRSGFFEMIERASSQYAKGYAAKIHLSGVSTSNVELGGRALDYGATTAVRGYGQAVYVVGEAPFGSVLSLRDDFILELAQDLRLSMPADILAGIPSDEELSSYLNARYSERVSQYFLELVGTPKEYSAQLVKHEKGLRLATLLRKMAEAGNTEPVKWQEIMPETGTYNLEKVLNAYILGEDLKTLIPDQALRAEFHDSMGEYRLALAAVARPDGIRLENLNKYMQIAIAARNRSLDNLVWNSKLDKEFIAVGEQFAKHGISDAFQKYADQTLAKSIREYKAPPFKLIVGDNSSIKRGKTAKIIFNLKTGEMERETKVLAPCERIMTTQPPPRAWNG